MTTRPSDIVARHVEISLVRSIGLSGILWRLGHHGTMLVDAIFPPAAGDHVHVLPVPSAAFPLHAVKNCLAVAELRQSIPQLLKLLFDIHFIILVLYDFRSRRWRGMRPAHEYHRSPVEPAPPRNCIQPAA